MAPFDKHPELIVRQEEPLNGGPPLRLLGRYRITPTELFFVRNHASVPEIDLRDYRLRVTGLVPRPLELSLDDLRQKFRPVSLEATLQCAGNRRQELMAVEAIPGEVPWGAEAVSTASWSGVPLKQLLEASGLQPGVRHVAFTGLDEVDKGGEPFGFGGSIPLAKAMSDEVLLAYEMNGRPLPPVHGFPLRAVVPGYIGARSVKWLGGIEARKEPSENHFQQRAYKRFPSSVRPDSADWSQAEMLGEYPVNAVICEPGDGETLGAGQVTVRGYALGLGGRRVEGVELSSDGASTWIAAELSESPQWSWCLWQARLGLQPGRHELVVRARDAAGHTQPADAASIWNFKGYMSNPWQWVRLQAEE
ncbi:MAG: molybdopterin-dependent oxidoreductase [Thermoanaerobaculia bacterium]